jgi:hypothetical protein
MMQTTMSQKQLLEGKLTQNMIEPPLYWLSQGARPIELEVLSWFSVCHC